MLTTTVAIIVAEAGMCAPLRLLPMHQSQCHSSANVSAAFALLIDVVTPRICTPPLSHNNIAAMRMSHRLQQSPRSSRQRTYARRLQQPSTSCGSVGMHAAFCTNRNRRGSADERTVFVSRSSSSSRGSAGMRRYAHRLLQPSRSSRQRV